MNTQEIVTQVFAELTRYPIDILTPDADLEAELGIDSVKRTEIIAELQQRFGLPADSAPSQPLTSIGAVARFVDSVREGGAEQGGAEEAGSRGAGSNGAGSNGAANGLANGAPHGGADASAAILVTVPASTPSPSPAPGPSTPLDGIGWAAAAPRSAPAPARAPTPAPVRAPSVARAPASPAASPPIAADAVRREVLSVLHEVTGEAMRRLESPSAQARGPYAAPSSARAPTPTPWIPAGYQPLSGRVALVTGSGHGLGRVIALRLAELGARLVVNSFHSREQGERVAAEVRERGGDAVHLWASVARRDHLERLFAEIDQRFGYLDFFVSNASNGIIAPLSQVTEDHWDKSFKTNVVGLHRGAMLAAPLMDRRGGGRIVTISSPGADRYIEHFGCQGPVKAALESLVRYLAVELGPRNIQVNALSAGPVYGDLLNKYPDGERLIPYWESRTTHAQLATEADIAEAVAWMLSPMGAAFSGATLLADATGSIRV